MSVPVWHACNLCSWKVVWQSDFHKWKPILNTQRKLFNPLNKGWQIFSVKSQIVKVLHIVWCTVSASVTLLWWYNHKATMFQHNFTYKTKVHVSRSVMSSSLWPHGRQPTRLLCTCNSPGKNTGVACHSLLQGIFPTRGSDLGLLHSRLILYHLSHQGSPVQEQVVGQIWLLGPSLPTSTLNK